MIMLACLAGMLTAWATSLACSGPTRVALVLVTILLMVSMGVIAARRLHG